jgi:hypothetical protein
MTYVVGYSRRLQRLSPVELKLRLVRGAEVGATIISFIFLFAFVMGLF